jgi:hypothetical protein
MFKISRLTLAIAAVGLSANLAANELTAAAITTESGIDFTPMVQARLAHNDNIASTSTNEESSWIFAVTPSLRALLQDGANVYTSTLSVASGTYFSSSDDNYLDFYADAKAKVELNQSNRFEAGVEYVSGHEDRGTGVSEGLGNLQDEPAEFDTWNLNAHYEYGAMSTPARVRVMAGYFDKEFTNYEALTSVRNFDKFSYGAALYYDTQATTSVVAEIIREDIAYDLVDPTGKRDSVTTKYRVGMEWQATALTSGSFRIGYQDKNFDSAERKDFSGLTWEASVAYAPLSYSTFQLTTGRQAKDPNVEGDFVKETLHGVSWTHDWSELFSSTAGFNYSHEDYSGADRTDKTKALSLAANYLLRTNIMLTAGTDLTRKSSTVQNIRFDKNVFYVGVQAGF